METRLEAVEEELARSRKMTPDDTSADMLWDVSEADNSIIIEEMGESYLISLPNWHPKAFTASRGTNHEETLFMRHHCSWLSGTLLAL